MTNNIRLKNSVDDTIPQFTISSEQEIEIGDTKYDI